MAGLADLMYGGGFPPAQAYAVPQPQVSMADILGGGQLPTQAAGGAMSTAFADSPAPGAVAAAGAQANAAAAQEPGILERARNWASTNPSQAQALMQGFQALASGRTQGGTLQQLGQAAGVFNQTMVEQNGANSAAEQERQRYATKQGMAQADQDSVIGNRAADNARQDRATDAQIAASQSTIASNKERIATSEQARNFSSKMETPKMRQFNLQIQKLEQGISEAKDEATMQKLRLDKAKLEYKYFEQFGESNAAAQNRKVSADASAAEERATGEIFDTDAKVKTAEEIAKLSPEDQRNYRLGIKPKEAKAEKSVQEIANELFKADPARYTNPDGSINYKGWSAEVNAIRRGGAAPEGTQQAWEKARNSVKVGQSYIGPDGQEYTRK